MENSKGLYANQWYRVDRNEGRRSRLVSKLSRMHGEIEHGPEFEALRTVRQLTGTYRREQRSHVMTWVMYSTQKHYFCQLSKGPAWSWIGNRTDNTGQSTCKIPSIVKITSFLRPTHEIQHDHFATIDTCPQYCAESC